jgi:hypothetical protein
MGVFPMFNPVDENSLRRVVNPIEDTIVSDPDSITVITRQF